MPAADAVDVKPSPSLKSLIASVQKVESPRLADLGRRVSKAIEIQKN